MIGLSYLNNLMTHVYFIKFPQEIHTLIFLQLDWMLKETLIFFSKNVSMLLQQSFVYPCLIMLLNKL